MAVRDSQFQELVDRVTALEKISKERSELLLNVMKNIERFTSSDVLVEINNEFKKLNDRIDGIENS